MKIIIGLGNPGKQYEKTRHNLGFMAIDALAEHYSLSWQTNKKFNSDFSKNNDLILVKPLTYMNNSGQAVQAVLSYYKLLPKKLGLFTAKSSDLSDVLTIIHDDIDIELGKHKISTDSGSAGHNGVQSIINYLKTKNFNRIRIGVRTEMANNIPTDKFVLQKFNQEELKVTSNIINKITTKLIQKI